MVERLRWPPGLVAVTILAIFAEATFMRLDRAVAADARARGLAKFFLRSMTTLATHEGMSTCQLEVGACMIEGLSIQLDYVGLSAFVVGVAVLAIAAHRVAIAAVKATALRTIGCYVLMTSQAALWLRVAGE